MNVQKALQMLIQRSPKERALLLNRFAMGFDAVLNVQFSSVGSDEVIATLIVEEKHTQPYGLVHGGVYCSLAESIASVGGTVALMSKEMLAVGAENRMRFLRAARVGEVLTAKASHLQTSGRILTWAVDVFDAKGNVCARGEVDIAALRAEQSVAGQQLSLTKPLPLDELKEDKSSTREA